jgi:prepilin-type N-terminal cleavage/methylation domain-containing protein
MSDRSQAGFSLIEALIATAILLILFGAATNGSIRPRSSARWSVTGRKCMVRPRRTELMQQEIGQAGRIALPDRSRQPQAS